MKKSRLLLGLGAMTIASIPILAIVSCSNSKGPNNQPSGGDNMLPEISEETKKIYDKIFDENNKDEYGYLENKLQSSLKTFNPPR